MDDRALDDIAQVQLGLVTAAQARAVLGKGRLQRWVQAGRLIRVQPRVYRVMGAPTTWRQLLLAAQLASGGLVTHRAAAEIWGLTRPAGVVEVAVAWHRQPRLFAPAIVHRLVDLDHARAAAVEREGLRVTDPVRTLVDLGLVVPPAEVGRALDAAVGRRVLAIADVRRLRQELSRSGRTGVGIIGQLLEERWPEDLHPESVLEARLLSALRHRGVATPTVQHEVWADGRLVARVDLAYPALRLAVEVDGFEHHTSVEAFQRDRARQNDLVALGWTVLRFTWDDVTRRPDHVAAVIEREIRRLTRSLCA